MNHQSVSFSDLSLYGTELSYSDLQWIMDRLWKTIYSIDLLY